MDGLVHHKTSDQGRDRRNVVPNRAHLWRCMCASLTQWAVHLKNIYFRTLYLGSATCENAATEISKQSYDKKKREEDLDDETKRALEIAGGVTGLFLFSPSLSLFFLVAFVQSA